MNSNRLAPALIAVALFALPASPLLAQQAMPTATPTARPAPGTTSAAPKPGRTRPMLRAKAPTEPRIGITGVWEVQIQHPNRTSYAHFSIHQTGESVAGTYLDPHGKKARFAGSLSQGNLNIVVTLPGGKILRFVSELNGTTDMVGMYTDAAGKRIAFTASYRPKEKFFDSLSPVPGGLGGVGNGPGGGGAYNPPR